MAAGVDDVYEGTRVGGEVDPKTSDGEYVKMSQACKPPIEALARIAHELETLIYSKNHSDDLQSDWHGYAGEAIGALNASIEAAKILDKREPNRTVSLEIK